MNWVTEKRLARSVSTKWLARVCGCTETLIGYAERGMPVHPVFADRIAKALGATVDERNMIVLPKHRRRVGDAAKKAKPAEPPKAEKPKRIGLAANAVAVVILDRAGNELGRYDSATDAGHAMGIDGNNARTAVSRRCNRRVGREYELCGATFRFAAEWDAMTPAERKKDLGIRG